MLLMSAVRHSARKKNKTTITRTQPMRSARFRLSSDVSMNVAGRKIRGSTSTPLMAGARLTSASSTPLVTSNVFAPSCFSTISRSPGALLMTASPMGGGKLSTTRATSPIRIDAPPRSRTTICSRSFAEVTALRCEMANR